MLGTQTFLPYISVCTQNTGTEITVPHFEQKPLSLVTVKIPAQESMLVCGSALPRPLVLCPGSPSAIIQSLNSCELLGFRSD